ncbi:MAG TPA: acylphosphatase [Gammaproteobacteria bacterium]|nr:acylphosphatase [Gammaproteobacteria bacterium]HJN00346.1 acylphosphatase [Gammaproteobacteria bacterium]
MVNRAFVVSGLVQGVFFRDSTRKEAYKLGLKGSAVNLPDGTVKVCLRGEDKQIDIIKDWLSIGPEFANVESVIEVDIDQQLELNGFKVG